MHHRHNTGFRAACRSLMESRRKRTPEMPVMKPQTPICTPVQSARHSAAISDMRLTLKGIDSVTSELEDLRRGIEEHSSSATQSSFLEHSTENSNSNTSDTTVHEWVRETATLEVELGILLATPRFKDSVFNSSLASYITIFVRIVELSEISPVHLVNRYLMPLLKHTNDYDHQHIVLFETACKVVRILLDTIDNQELVQALECNVLPPLLEAAKTISIHSEVAFETCNYILSEPFAPRDCLNRVILTRLKDSSFYGPDLIPFRMMRAEWLRLIADSSAESDEKNLIEEGCIVEIKASLLYEPDDQVCSRYKEVFNSSALVLKLEPGLFKGQRRKFIRRRGNKVQ